MPRMVGEGGNFPSWIGEKEHTITFIFLRKYALSVQFSCLVMSNCDPMDCSMPGLPVHHQLTEFTQIHLHRVGDAIQLSHPVISFSSHPQSFPASGSFQMSQLFTSGGQSIGVSASTSVLPMNIQDWFPLGWTGWISLQSKGFLDSWSFHKLESLLT